MPTTTNPPLECEVVHTPELREKCQSRTLAQAPQIPTAAPWAGEDQYCWTVCSGHQVGAGCQRVWASTHPISILMGAEIVSRALIKFSIAEHPVVRKATNSDSQASRLS